MCSAASQVFIRTWRRKGKGKKGKRMNKWTNGRTEHLRSSYYRILSRRGQPNDRLQLPPNGHTTTPITRGRPPPRNIHTTVLQHTYSIRYHGRATNKPRGFNIFPSCVVHTVRSLPLQLLRLFISGKLGVPEVLKLHGSLDL